MNDFPRAASFRVGRTADGMLRVEIQFSATDRSKKPLKPARFAIPVRELDQFLDTLQVAANRDLPSSKVKH